METFPALLAICAGNSPVTGEFPTQKPVTRIFDVFFDLCLNKRLSKQSWGWWFETLSYLLWRHRNEEVQGGQMLRHHFIISQQRATHVASHKSDVYWWRQDMGVLNALLVLCEGNPLVSSEFSEEWAMDLERWCFGGSPEIAVEQSSYGDLIHHGVYQCDVMFVKAFHVVRGPDRPFVHHPHNKFPVTMIVPASGHQVRCIPWVQMGTFNKEIGFLCGLKFFALNIFLGEYQQPSLHLM